MEELEIEQTENEAQTALAENVDGEGTQEFSFKKFKDVKSLQMAYSSLESEFTKRSQKIKELQGENCTMREELKTKCDSFDSLQKAVEEQSLDNRDGFYKKHPTAKQYLKELSLGEADRVSEGVRNLYDEYIALLEQKIDNDKQQICNENYLLSKIESTTIKEKIIRQYLEDINNSKPKAKFIKSGGEIPLAPPIKPKTFEEAGRLCGEYLRK